MAVKIAHLVPYTFISGAGVSSVAASLASIQNKNGCSTKIFEISKDGKNADLSAGVIGTAIMGSPKFSFAPGLIKKIVDFKPDIIHVHGIWTYFGVAALTASQKLKKPYVVSTHGMMELWAWGRNRGRKKILQWIFQNKIFKAAAALLVYESEMPVIRQLGLETKTYKVVNGIDEAIFSKNRSKTKFKKLYPFLENKKIILFLARVHPKKGLVPFLNAFSKVCGQFPEWHFVIAGPDEDGHAKEIAGLIEKLNLDKRVSIVGSQNGEAKWDFFAAADLFVLTSFSEGFSISILEAMGSELPVLVSKNCYFDELEKAECGLVCEVNEGAIERCLRRFLSMDLNQLRQMGRNGRELIRSQYTWEKIHLEILDIYQKAIKGQLVAR